MNDTRSHIIVALFAFIPYLLVSWAYTVLTDGHAKEFWTAFGVLLLVRLFFSIIETLGSILSWRLYGKRVLVGKFLEILRANKFPSRQFAHDDFDSYLVRIVDDESEYSESIRAAAKEFRVIQMVQHSNAGFLAAMRLHSAVDTALDIYSPKSQAQELTQSLAQP